MDRLLHFYRCLVGLCVVYYVCQRRVPYMTAVQQVEVGDGPRSFRNFAAFLRSLCCGTFKVPLRLGQFLPRFEQL